MSLTLIPLEFHNTEDYRNHPTLREKGEAGKEGQICICDYKTAKADSMQSSAKKRTITLTHQHVASKLYSLFQTEAIIRLPKRGYPAETQLVLIRNKHNAIKGQAASYFLPHKL